MIEQIHNYVIEENKPRLVNANYKYQSYFEPSAKRFRFPACLKSKNFVYDLKPYQPLPFNQYFTDIAQGSWDSGKPSVKFKYDEIDYRYKRKHYHAFYKVRYDKKRGVIQIYFKETSDKTGWAANFDFFSRYYDSFQHEGDDIQLKTATGWGQMYNSIKWYMRNTIRDLCKKHGPVPVEILGWSLGSALAQICAQDLYFNFDIKSHIYTFGSVKPWYGFDKVMKNYLSKCYMDCYNISDINDIVTYQVPFPGYFKLNNVKVAQDKFCIARLFKPKKYHTEYWKEELYKNLLITQVASIKLEK